MVRRFDTNHEILGLRALLKAGMRPFVAAGTERLNFLIGFMALPFGAIFINVSIVLSAFITRLSTGKDFLKVDFLNKLLFR